MVPGTVVVADDGRTADGIPHKHRHKQESRIHDDAVSRHPILPGKAEELVVVQDVHQRHRNIGHQLGRAVDAGVPQHPPLKLGSDEVEAAGVVPLEEIEHRQHAAHQLAEEGRNGSTGHAPLQDAHQQHIQHHVGAACTHRKGKPQLGLLRGDKKALEQILPDKGRNRHQQDPAVGHGVFQHLPFCPQQQRDGPHQKDPQHAQHDADGKRRPDKETEIAVRLLRIALAEGDGNDGTAAGAQHEPDRADQHGQRHNEVDGREGRFADEIRDAQAVHDAVDGSEQHGADAGQHEPDQPGNIKMVGQLDGLLGHNFSFFGSQGTKKSRTSPLPVRLPSSAVLLCPAQPPGNAGSGILSGSSIPLKQPSDAQKTVYQSLFFLSRQPFAPPQPRPEALPEQRLPLRRPFFARFPPLLRRFCRKYTQSLTNAAIFCILSGKKWHNFPVARFRCPGSRKTAFSDHCSRV